jgi:hypothetical protein
MTEISPVGIGRDARDVKMTTIKNTYSYHSVKRTQETPLLHNEALHFSQFERICRYY